MQQLEAEKSELLNETNELLKQISSYSHEVNTCKELINEITTDNNNKQDLINLLTAKNSELSIELVDRSKQEKDVHANYNLSINQFKDEIGKLDNVIKENKKNSSVQIIELTNQNNTLYNEAVLLLLLLSSSL